MTSQQAKYTYCTFTFLLVLSTSIGLNAAMPQQSGKKMHVKRKAPARLERDTPYDDFDVLREEISSGASYDHAPIHSAEEQDRLVNLLVATTNNNIEDVRALCTNTDITRSLLRDGSTALHIAAHAGFREIVSILLSTITNYQRQLQYIAKPNARRETALSLAAERNFISTVEILMLFNPPQECVAHALAQAALFKHVEVLVLMLTRSNHSIDQLYNDAISLLMHNVNIHICAPLATAYFKVTTLQKKSPRRCSNPIRSC